MAVEKVVKAEALELTRTFAAPRAKVFEAWTDPEILKQWHAPGDYTVPIAEADLRVGGRYRIRMQAPNKDINHTVGGEYKEIVPNEKLVYTWQWEDDVDDVGETLVTVEFRDNGEGTDIVLTHERFPTAEDRDKHNQGWCGSLDNLPKLFS